MSYIPPNPNGQSTMANSAPVVLASNQTSVPTSLIANSNTATVTPLGQLNTTVDPNLLFADTFDLTTIDTTNRWTIAGTVPPTQNSAILVNPGATASATSAINSQYAFPGGVNTSFGLYITLEATTIATGNYRFWGYGTSPSGVGTSAAPIQDGIGYDVTTGGVLRAVVYNAGAVVFSQDLTAITDGLSHLYLINQTGINTFFYIDTVASPVAFTPKVPNLQSLPVRIVSLNSGSVTGTPTLVGNSAGIADYAHQAQSVSDGILPYKKASVLLGDVGYSGLAVASGTKTLTFTTSAAGAQTILANTNVEGYNWIEVVYTSVGVGLALTGQFSTVSGGTYVNHSSFINMSTGTAPAALGVTVGTNYGSVIHGNTFQIAVSALTSGTFTGTVILRALPPPLPNVNVTSTPATTNAYSVDTTVTSTASQSVFSFTGLLGTNIERLRTANLGAATTGTGVLGSNNMPFDGTNYQKGLSIINATNSTGTGIMAVGSLAQFDDVSPTAITENQFGNVRMSANRNQYVTMRDAAGNERGANVTAESGLATSMQASATGAYTYNHISTSTTTTVKSGVGTLHAISVNTKGTVASTITVYDNTAGSGTVIGVIDSLNLYGIFILDVAFATGLTIVTTGTVAPDLTVSYK